MKRSLLVAFLATGAVAIGGCGGDSPVGPADDVLAGRTYVLVTVDGGALPYEHPGTTSTTLWSNIIFDPARATFELTTQYCREMPCAGGNVLTQEVNGTYTRSGDVISFTELRPGSLRFDGQIEAGGDRVVVDINHPILGQHRRVYVD
jgi:hypothetical protein